MPSTTPSAQNLETSIIRLRQRELKSGNFWARAQRASKDLLLIQKNHPSFWVIFIFVCLAQLPPENIILSKSFSSLPILFHWCSSPSALRATAYSGLSTAIPRALNCGFLNTKEQGFTQGLFIFFNNNQTLRQDQGDSYNTIN